MKNMRGSRRDFLKATGAVVVDVAARGTVSAGARHGAADAPVTAWNVRDFGARGDGRQLDTVAINQAIAAAAAAGGARFICLPVLIYAIRST